MSQSLYKLTRQIIIIISLILCANLILEKELLRTFMYCISVLLFLVFSKQYEKKRGIITVTYIFVIFIVFIVYSFVPALLTTNKLNDLNVSGRYGYWLDDIYPLYFFSVFFVYVIMIIYTHFSKNKFKDKIYNIKIDDKENLKINLACLLILALYIIFKKYELMVVIFACLIAKLIFKKEKRILNIFVLIIMVIFGNQVFLSRYKLVGIVFPIFIMYIIMNKNSNKRIKMSKLYIMFLVAFALVMLYGIVSEVYKLNSNYNGNYSLLNILTSFDSTKIFMERQLYRMFGIWIKLGGYIISHANKNGFYYGLTYIKFLADPLGFKYISLPAISAVYDGANYAQPGLLAEGYANFGFVGGIANILSVFFFMEYMTGMFYKRNTYTDLLMASIPFSQILLDGGTLNSAIFTTLVCFIIFIIVNLDKNKIYLGKGENNENFCDYVCLQR